MSTKIPTHAELNAAILLIAQETCSVETFDPPARFTGELARVDVLVSSIARAMNRALELGRVVGRLEGLRMEASPRYFEREDERFLRRDNERGAFRILADVRAIADARAKRSPYLVDILGQPGTPVGREPDLDAAREIGHRMEREAVERAAKRDADASRAFAALAFVFGRIGRTNERPKVAR